MTNMIMVNARTNNNQRHCFITNETVGVSNKHLFMAHSFGQCARNCVQFRTDMITGHEQMAQVTEEKELVFESILISY